MIFSVGRIPHFQCWISSHLEQIYTPWNLYYEWKVHVCLAYLNDAWFLIVLQSFVSNLIYFLLLRLEKLRFALLPFFINKLQLILGPFTLQSTRFNRNLSEQKRKMIETSTIWIISDQLDPTILIKCQIYLGKSWFQKFFVRGTICFDSKSHKTNSLWSWHITNSDSE